MTLSRIFLGLFFLGILTAAVPAAALEGKTPVWRYYAHSSELPFPRSKRAEAVWASVACWSDCGSYCTWGLAGCLKEDSQGRCLKFTDKCDRYCQRQCRTRGGPLLSDRISLGIGVTAAIRSIRPCMETPSGRTWLSRVAVGRVGQ